MNIWVTGANGFTGRHLLKQLAAEGQGAKIVGLFRSEPDEVPEGVDVEIIDLADASLVRERIAAGSPDQVYHLAGTMPPATQGDIWQSFVTNSYHLLNALSELDKPARLLISGSAAEYSPNETGVFSESDRIGGLSDYGMAKAAQTILCRAAGASAGLDVVVARTFNILGPGMSADFVVGKICQQLKQGVDELVLGNLESERDFLDVRDVASAYRTVMNSSSGIEVVNVCSGQGIKIGEMVNQACSVFGVQPTVTSKFRNHGFDIDRAIGDASLLKEGFDWQPEISIAQSLADIRDS